MSTLTQIREIVLMNLKSIPQRLGASLVIVIGIAGVVGVLVAMLGWGACYLLSLVFGVIYLKSVVRNGVVTANQHDLMTAVLWLRAIIPAAYAAHFCTKE